MSVKSQLYTGISCLAAGLLIGWTVNGYRMQSKIDELEKEYAEKRAEATEYHQQVMQGLLQRIKNFAKEYQDLEDKASKETAELKKELKDAKAKTPLPADCRLDSVRMRILQDAVNKANQRTP